MSSLHKLVENVSLKRGDCAQRNIWGNGGDYGVLYYEDPMFFINRRQQKALYRVQGFLLIWSLAVDELRSPSGPLLRNVQAAPVPLSESHKLAEYSKRKGPV
ncbi:hypothetical protein MUA03_16490, partial [Enterobacteriaceae bacterium H16N7]|nr:hypothetical protein [Dryocola clanedunensis]